ncbi:helix-turn-helix domain-containing protein [Marichromatium gracile]|uniref:Helix-turn-helix protein n=1 Tax=Marichromatium gracile TaxID=1048 RepID=A0A4R4AK68_MARGR|nr:MULTISPECIES: helix-turn-helix transcriptional regulator [Marichromatium]MBO8086698.1 helix-turn-helix transcriptional regulator [Marichromatium sp.]KXX63686.1 XRE family transcriptional regulator [Marichromatium gracile]MBK1707803.1 XRE family transcriptional regulator [Marichromatium gracile]MCF1184317.1 helix-turn-helix domain-containing protein [Marichromatium gracile]RNE92082.1 XRE family transcriptional regulator [Marichromatium sp. AB31]
MDLTKRIGQRLRAARQEQKLSLSDLSSRTNSLSKSRISNYEQGIRRMGLEEAHELSMALRTVTPTYLLCLDDKGPLDAEEMRLVEFFRLSDERGRATVLEVAERQSEFGVAAKAAAAEEQEQAPLVEDELSTA